MARASTDPWVATRAGDLAVTLVAPGSTKNWRAQRPRRQNSAVAGFSFGLRAPQPATGSKLDPRTAAPITTALVFTPRVVLAFLPFPIVRVDGEAEFWAIIVIGVGVPAVALSVADDTRRRRRRGKSEGARAHQGGEGHFAEDRHFWVSSVLKSRMSPNGSSAA